MDTTAAAAATLPACLASAARLPACLSAHTHVPHFSYHPSCPVVSRVDHHLSVCVLVAGWEEREMREMRTTVHPRDFLTPRGTIDLCRHVMSACLQCVSMFVHPSPPFSLAISPLVSHGRSCHDGLFCFSKAALPAGWLAGCPPSHTTIGFVCRWLAHRAFWRGSGVACKRLTFWFIRGP